MRFLPLFFDIKDKPCLVVGGGDIALRKSRLLVRSGATLTVVAPKICDSLKVLVEKEGVIKERAYKAEDINGTALVVAATDCEDINAQVSKDAQAINIHVNVVDSPAISTFIFPAIIDRSPIVIGVSSGGASPVLARLIRAKLESTIPAAYGRLAALVGGFRDRVKQKFSTINERRAFWEEVLQGPVADQVFAGKEQDAKALLNSLLDDKNQKPSTTGEVYLVGGGPGDPDLLTFRALRLMQQADVVLYDRLVSKGVLDLVRRDADLIYVGKAKSDHAVPQEEINEMLVRLAKKGHRVLRLKGGDPFIFGRGGEEIDRIAEEGIPFQVVPGITAASGCASYAGIPLTHRDYSQSVRFVTGHLKEGELSLEWSELAHANQTVVFYMGLTGLEVICKKLMELGRSPQTPIALIQQGTTRSQKVVEATLETIVERVANEVIKPPTLIIVGEVVSLRKKLNWFDPDKQQ